MRFWRKTFLTLLSAASLVAGTATPSLAKDAQSFTIAVIPDTQFYLDYTHQKAAGYPFDAADIFLQQMDYIASRAGPQGDIAFVTSVGDVWQHPTKLMDPAHAARGFARVRYPMFDDHMAPSGKVRTVEMPTARQGFERISGKVPFSVVPGNHDFDAQWIDSKHPPSATERFGKMHVGGNENFDAVFGADTPFFKGKSWYVDSYNGGADSAQIFTAGGYRFLHIGLEFDPSDSALAWAQAVVSRYPGLPTIISTHNFVNTAGDHSLLNNSHAVDPIDNNPQMVWDKFVSQNDQIFLILCGHSHGAAFRKDDNRNGHPVYQLLADYQGRQQVPKDAGMKPTEFDGNGDGWLRLMTFDMSASVPTITVRTYSTHYKKFSTEIADYANWYKTGEHPEMSDVQFNALDDFVISLNDFRLRFGKSADK